MFTSWLRLLANTLWLVLILLSNHASYAAPALFSPWPSLKVNNPEQLDYLRDDKNQSVIWLKPPRMGLAKVEGEVSDHPNHQLCGDLSQSLRDVLASSDELKDGLDKLKSYDSRLIAAVDKQFKAAQALKAAVATVEEADRLVAKQLALLLNRLADARLELIGVIHRVDGCRKECRPVYLQKEHLEQHIASLERELAYQSQRSPKVQELAERLKQLSEVDFSHRKTIDKIYRSRALALHHLGNAERRLFKSYGSKAIIQAGEQEVHYDIGWRAAIERFAKLNPKLNVRAIPIRSLRFRSRLVPETIDDFYLATQPIFLDFSSNLPLLARLGEVDGASDSGFTTAALSQLAGSYSYSLAGFCASHNEGYQKHLADKVSFDAGGKPNFGAVLTYSYLVKLPRKVTIEIHPYQLYSKIQELTNYGGHISTNDYRRWLDEERFADSLRLPADIEPQLAQIVKKEAVDRVLAATATAISAAPTAALTPPAKPCTTYACKLTGWDALNPKLQQQAEVVLKRENNGWQSMTLGEGMMLTLTDIALFDQNPFTKGTSR